MLSVARRSQGQVTARIQRPVKGFPFSHSSFLPLLFVLQRCLEHFCGPGCPRRKMLAWWNRSQHRQQLGSCCTLQGLRVPLVLLLAPRALLVFQSSTTQNFPGRARRGQCSELGQHSFGRGRSCCRGAEGEQRARLARLPSACARRIKQIMACNAAVWSQPWAGMRPFDMTERPCWKINRGIP